MINYSFAFVLNVLVRTTVRILNITNRYYLDKYFVDILWIVTSSISKCTQLTKYLDNFLNIISYIISTDHD